MTNDKARKRAARERAAATGERYTTALRRLGEPAATIATPRLGMLQRLTHAVPGVPAHVEGGLQASRAGGRPRRNAPHAQPRHTPPQHGEPRVLAAWQNRIARLVGAAGENAGDRS
jgi:hypothetical protein